MDFSEVANFPYSDDVVARDIEVCLKTGQYHPSYRQTLHAYLVSQLKQFKPYITGFEHECHFIFTHALQLSEIKAFICEQLHITASARQKSIGDKLTAQLPVCLAGGDSFSVPDENNKIHIVVLVGEAEDPLCSLYNAVHELIHALQAKRLYSDYFSKIGRQAWMWRDQGYSEDKIEGVLKATNFNYEKVSKIARAYKEIQANAGAALYLMVQALKTKTPSLIAQTETFILTKSSSMSDSLMLSGQGVTFCDFPVTKKIMEGLNTCGWEMFFDRSGNFDWDKLYKCTAEQVKNIGYTPHMIMDADKKEGAFLRSLDQKYPDRKQMVTVLKWCPDYKTNKILQDYVAAQEVSLKLPPTCALKTFHSQLANPLKRADILFNERYNNIPGIEHFRDLYQQREIADTYNFRSQ